MEPGSIGIQVRQHRIKRGLSQEDLARQADIGQSTVDRIEKGQWKRMPSALPRVMQLLGMRLEEFNIGFTQQSDATYLGTGHSLVGERNLPVYGAAEAGSGVVVVSSDPVDYVRRPSPLEGVKAGYGLIIVNDSMVPEFRPGDTALVHPHLPPVRDECCVFYADNGHGEIRATLKCFIRATESHWHVQQWNPKKKFTLSRKEWQKCHRVVGKYSRR